MDFPYGTIAIDNDGNVYMVLAPVPPRANDSLSWYHVLVVREPSGDRIIATAGEAWLAAHVVVTP